MRKASATSHWTPLPAYRKIEKIKEHWEDGSSAKQIAERIGNDVGATISRQAIIGVYDRNPTEFTEHPLRQALSSGNRTRGERREQARRPRAPKAVATASYYARVKVEKPAPVYHPEPEPLRVTLAELDANQCRWPVNNAAVQEPHLFCGAPAAGLGEPYCHHHKGRSVGEGTKSEREAAKVRAGA